MCLVLVSGLEVFLLLSYSVPAFDVDLSLRDKCSISGMRGSSSAPMVGVEGGPAFYLSILCIIEPGGQITNSL
jgi:hypothetical protein